MLARRLHRERTRRPRPPLHPIACPRPAGRRPPARAQSLEGLQRCAGLRFLYLDHNALGEAELLRLPGALRAGQGSSFGGTLGCTALPSCVPRAPTHPAAGVARLTAAAATPTWRPVPLQGCCRPPPAWRPWICPATRAARRAWRRRCWPAARWRPPSSSTAGAWRGADAAARRAGSLAGSVRGGCVGRHPATPCKDLAVPVHCCSNSTYTRGVHMIQGANTGARPARAALTQP